MSMKVNGEIESIKETYRGRNSKSKRVGEGKEVAGEGTERREGKGNLNIISNWIFSILCVIKFLSLLNLVAFPLLANSSFH